MEITISNIDHRKQKKTELYSYNAKLSFTTYTNRKKNLKNDYFNPHSHLEETLINLYMNEKKSFGEVPLRIEETNRTSQLTFD